MQCRRARIGWRIGIRLGVGLGLRVAGAALALAAGAARALPIAIHEDQRSVAAEAAAGQISERDGAAAVAPAFDAVVSARALEAAAGAEQGSEASAARIDGFGHARAAAASEPGGFASASADSSYRIVFEPEADLVLRFTGWVGAFGVGAGDAFALLELSTVDPLEPPLLLRFQRGASEAADPLPVDELVALRGGIEYRLLVLARASGDSLDGDGATAQRAEFAFALAEVPEPGTALLVAIGLAALSGGGSDQRRVKRTLCAVAPAAPESTSSPSSIAKRATVASAAR